MVMNFGRGCAMCERSAAAAARAVRDHVAADLDRWVGLMGRMVAIDSGAEDPGGIGEVQQTLASALTPLGAEVSVTWVDGVPHLRATVAGRGPVVGIVGHADTVYPSGTADRRPMTLTGSRVQGPGTADMKAGLAMAAATVAALQACGLDHPMLEILIYGDEETRGVAPPDLGSPPLDACLVLECGRPGGGYVTARKAGAWVTLRATGTAAHSGVDPDRGRNAIVALCQTILAVTDLHRSRPDLSVSVGRVTGGTSVNTVPASAEAQVDLRAIRTDDLDGALADLHGLIARQSGQSDAGPPDPAAVEVAAIERWPAMEAANGEHLSAAYRTACAAVDLDATPLTTGGTSDGAWFADRGIPTLDGLGPIGGMDHSPQEHLDLDSFAPRAGALAGLLRSLSG